MAEAANKKSGSDTITAAFPKKEEKKMKKLCLQCYGTPQILQKFARICYETVNHKTFSLPCLLYTGRQMDYTVLIKEKGVLFL